MPASPQGTAQEQELCGTWMPKARAYCARLCQQRRRVLRGLLALLNPLRDGLGPPERCITVDLTAAEGCY